VKREGALVLDFNEYYNFLDSSIKGGEFEIVPDLSV